MKTFQVKCGCGWQGPLVEWEVRVHSIFTTLWYSRVKQPFTLIYILHVLLPHFTIDSSVIMPSKFLTSICCYAGIYCVHVYIHACIIASALYFGNCKYFSESIYIDLHSVVLPYSNVRLLTLAKPLPANEIL